MKKACQSDPGLAEKSAVTMEPREKVKGHKRHLLVDTQGPEKFAE
jgi:hypothetical protein